jgi:hypothetical protein
VSDNFFNYFSSRGTKRVDPIDDADFESIDAPDQPAPAAPVPAEIEKPVASTREGASPVSSGVEVSQISSASPSKEEPRRSQPVAESKSSKKETGGHWDYLASLLGIKKSPSATVSEAAPEVFSSQPVMSSPEIEPASLSAKTSFFELEPVPAEKEVSILSSLFPATEPTGDAGPDVDDDELESDDSIELDAEYLEFEIEELETTRDGDEPPSERRLRRTRDKDPGEVPAPRRERAADRNDSPAARRRDPRRGEMKTDRGRRDRQDEPRASRAENTRSRDPGAKHPVTDVRMESAKPKRREAPDDAPRVSPRRNEESSFGAGIFESDSFETPSRMSDHDEPKAEKRKRRRRRGRNRAKESVTDHEEIPTSPVRSSELPFQDPPDEYFDEIGWQPAKKEALRPTYSDDRSGDAPEFDDDDYISPASGQELPEEEKEGDGRKRRRRRGRRSGAEDREMVSDRETFSRDEVTERPRTTGRSHIEADDFEDDDEEFSSRPARGNDHGRSSDRSVSSEDKKKKFPTWEEAISGLVDSNIKNHSRSGGQNRTNKRGRRRR